MLEIRALGGLDVRDSAEPSTSILDRPEAAALLAYLVLGLPGVAHPRDELAGLFWPDLDPADARDTLERTLDFLREELPDGLIEAHGAGLVGIIPRRVHCDVYAFEDAVAAERWEEALELYRGDLLEGLEVPGSDGFHRWLEAEREWMRGLAELARKGTPVPFTRRGRGQEGQDEIEPPRSS